MPLPRPQKVIRKRFDVDEQDKTLTFRHGTGGDASFGGASGNLFFLGMDGSGRRELAKKAAELLGLAYVEAADRQDLDAAVTGSTNQAVAVIDPALVESPEAVAAMRASGKVFAIMSLPHLLAARLGDPSRAEALAGEMARFEPAFLGAAHFVLAMDATPEEMLEDVAEKARL